VIFFQYSIQMRQKPQRPSKMSSGLVEGGLVEGWTSSGVLPNYQSDAAPRSGVLPCSV